MKRHEALQDLSRDHFHALNEVQAVRSAVDEKPGALSLDAARAEILRFWEADAHLHFREEEEVLLPIASRYGPPTEDAAIRRMLDDHAWFREAIEAFRAATASSEPADAEALNAFVDRLEAHVRHEERDLFESLQARFNATDLADLAARSLAFRRACRAPERIGPARPGGACAVR